MKLGLSRIQKALKKLENPCNDVPAIQIVGTNGKGSITAFLENILFNAKINIGTTTSPHLFAISERIRVNKEEIPEIEFENLFNHFQNYLEEFRLSPFEIIICCCLKYFDLKRVELLLLEAGLGGRLDATTAHKLRPIIAISRIGIDHSEHLGESLEQITKEKIAVIKKNTFVVSCKQKKQVKALINKKVEEVGAKIFWVSQLSEDWEIGLNGSFQKQNAAVAIGVVKVLNQLGWIIKKKHIKNGLANTKWSGRLEILNWESKEILVDSAHNPLAAKVLSKERVNWKYQEKGIYWIIGVQKQKNISSIMKNLVKPNDKVLLVPVPHQKSWTLKEIKLISKFNIKNIIEFNSFKEALKYLLELKQWPKCNPVITGSIFLVSEFINFSKEKKIN